MDLEIVEDEQFHIGADGTVSRVSPAPAEPTPAPSSPRPAWRDRGAVASGDPATQDAKDWIFKARHDESSPQYRALYEPGHRDHDSTLDRLLKLQRAIEPDNRTILALDESHEEAAQRTREEAATHEQAAFKALATAPPVRDDGRTFTPESWLPVVTFAEQQALAPAELESLGYQILAAEHHPQVTMDDLHALWGEDFDAKDARLTEALDKIPKPLREQWARSLGKRSVVLYLDRLLDRRAATKGS